MDEDEIVQVRTTYLESEGGILLKILSQFAIKSDSLLILASLEAVRVVDERAKLRLEFSAELGPTTGDLRVRR